MIRIFSLSAICAALLFTSQAHAAVWEIPYPRMGACTRYDTDIFRTVPFDEWESVYETYIQEAVDSIPGARIKASFAQRRAPIGSCTEQNAAVFLSAPTGIASLALKLEPWKDLGGTPELFGQSDMAPVLMELLRVYECAHIERIFLLPSEVLAEEFNARGGTAGYPLNPLSYSQLYQRMQKDMRISLERIMIARPTLERVLNLAGGLLRMRMIEAELDCVQRASLDINAGLALGAETSACLPRVWNAKDPLRDQPECSDGIDNDGDGKIDLNDDSCTSPYGTSES